MSNSNIGYLYYKEYYDDIIKKHSNKEKENEEYEQDFNKKNKCIIDNSNVEKIININNEKIKKDNNEFFLKTTYPGLLVGSGYNHIISRKGEFKLGFEFDYTTGLPIINGSSVKGLLRNAFYTDIDNDSIKREKTDYLKEILEEIEFNIEEIDDFKFIRTLRNEIFEGKKDGKDMPIYERDIFYDAMIDIEKTKNLLGNNKNILGEDFITPHKDPLKDPIPIKFIKVMPNVVWRFSFDLKDGNPTSLTSVKKLEMFKKIILDFGVGAKTNVGYGYMEEI